MFIFWHFVGKVVMKEIKCKSVGQGYTEVRQNEGD